MTKIYYDELPEHIEQKLQEYLQRKILRYGMPEVKILERYQNYTEAEFKILKEETHQLFNWYRVKIAYNIGFAHRCHRIFFYEPLQKWQK